MRGGDRPGAALYHILSLYCFSLLLRHIVSLFPCPQASSSARQSAILTSISIITLILTHSHTLHRIRTHSLYLPFRIQIQISHITIYLWLFDFRSSIFFSTLYRSFGLSNDSSLRVRVQRARSANLPWCPCQCHHPSPSNVDIPCTTPVFLSTSLTLAFPSASCVFLFFSLFSLLACYVISISLHRIHTDTVRCSANIITAGVHAGYSEFEEGFKYVWRFEMERKKGKQST